VSAVLDELCADRTVGPAHGWKDEWGYALFTRRPGFIRRVMAGQLVQSPMEQTNRRLTRARTEAQGSRSASQLK